MINAPEAWIDKAKIDFLNSTHLGYAVLIWINADGHPTFVTSMVDRATGDLDKEELTGLLQVVIEDVNRSSFDVQESASDAN